VTLEVEGIDSMDLNVYQPRLPCQGKSRRSFATIADTHSLRLP
jgi:hypothetical protein